MKFSHIDTLEARRFDSDSVKGVSGKIAIGESDGAERFCMRIFELSPEGYTPRHSHGWEHEIFVHSGEGEVWSQDGWTPVSAGSFVFIPGEEAHQIRNTGQGPMVFVCVIPSGPPEL